MTDCRHAIIFLNHVSSCVPERTPWRERKHMLHPLALLHGLGIGTGLTSLPLAFRLRS